MRPLLIGSRALRHWTADCREPADYDLLILSDQLASWEAENAATISERLPARPGKYKYILVDGTQLECETEHEDSVLDFLILGDGVDHRERVFGLDCNVATLDMLFALKKSHIYWPVNWFKNIADYGFLQGLSAKVTPEIEPAFQKRLAERRARGRIRTKYPMNVSNEQFFEKSEGSLNRKFRHDDLHATMKLFDAPLYTRAKIDQSKAALDKGLFFALPLEIQQRMVMEEAYVIAMERIIIPKWFETAVLVKNEILEACDFQIRPGEIEEAYRQGLMRICTTLTTGWFREFAVDNYRNVQNSLHPFCEIFWKAYFDGRVVPV